MSKKFSELDNTTTLGLNDIFAIAQEDSQSQTGFSSKRIAASSVANKLLNDFEYSSALQTTDKKVIGAINELATAYNAMLPVDEASGSIANFETELAAPLQSVLVNIAATQPSGTPTPSSPLPISGYTEANITRCGVNFWELSDDIKFDSQNCSYVYENNGVNITASGTYARVGYVNPVKVGQQYTISFYGQGTANFINVYYNNTNSWGDSYGRTHLSSTRTKYTKTITANSDILFVGFYTTSSGTTGDMVIEDFMLEVGSTASDTFTPYNGQTYTIAFGQTVYGGVLDVTRGKFHVTWGDVDLASITWGYTGNFFYAYLNNYKDNAGGSTIEMPHALCSTYTVGAIKNVYDGVDKTISLGTELNYSGRIILKDTAYTDAPTFQQNVTGKLAYELATPFDIDLTPVQIRALVGVNNVFNDTNGNTVVSYKDGIQHYIDKKIAQTQALIL